MRSADTAKENLEHFHSEKSSERASHSHHHGIVEPSP